MAGIQMYGVLARVSMHKCMCMSKCRYLYIIQLPVQAPQGLQGLVTQCQQPCMTTYNRHLSDQLDGFHQQLPGLPPFHQGVPKHPRRGASPVLLAKSFCTHLGDMAALKVDEELNILNLGCYECCWIQSTLW